MSSVSGDSGVRPLSDSQKIDPDALRLSDNEATIISNRAPITPPSMSDSVDRIVRGKILPGDRLGHYELVEYVGGGGMGRVFRAIDQRLARTVALKILSPEQAVDEDTLSRFQNEARSVARLNHDNIARVYHVDEDRGLHYIAFEFIEGTNIRNLVQRNGPLSLAEAVSCTLQVAEALAHAASCDVVHRDVKPSNVLITPEGRVKLIDMGLARFKRVDPSEAELTASGVTLGTFDYISPEQARDPRSADVRSDIYSLGCTFFYMLAGRPPFPEGTVLQKLLQHQGDQPPDVRQFRPELPEGVALVLRKMLAKDPRDRYTHPTELLADLMGLAEQVGLRPLGWGGKVLVPPQTATVSFLQRHLPWLVPVAALVAIVVLLDSYWSASPNNGLPLQQGRPHSSIGKPPAAGNPVVAMTGSEKSQTPPKGPDASPKTPAAPSPGGKIGNTPPTALPTEPVAQVPLPASGSTVPSPLPIGPSAVALRLDPRAAMADSRPDSRDLRFAPFDARMSVADGSSAALTVAPAVRAAALYLTGAGKPRGAVVEPAPERANVLVVNGSVTGEREYASLGAACSAAANNDVIELRYSGRREERPITLANVRLTIRAGEGYQPVVVFRPAEIDPVKYPRSMFTATSGQLTLCNVAWELHVPREVPADHWSLFETRGGQTVRLKKCALSIFNASSQKSAFHQEVAFFRVQSAPDAGASVGGAAAAATVAATPATVDLSDSIARGEATFVHVEDLQPMRVLWDNGLLATTERLLSAHGGQEPPVAGEAIEIDLRHLTAVIRGGLCQIADGQAASYQLNTRIRCSNCILVGTPGVPLIEQLGSDALPDFRAQMSWTGDSNFYEDVDVFWAIRNLDQQTLESKGYDDWKIYWGSESENLPRWMQVAWRSLPPPDRPSHDLTPADYLLDDSAIENPAIGAADDGSDAGFLLEQLPELPAAALPEPPSKTLPLPGKV